MHMVKSTFWGLVISHLDYFSSTLMGLPGFGFFFTLLLDKLPRAVTISHITLSSEIFSSSLLL